jgi:iron complex transport system ATP-binding protein
VSRDVAVLACRDLDVRFGVRSVLERLSLDIAGACWTSIIGPNGCGKSTLLRTLTGLILPLRGSVSLYGRPLNSWPRRERAKRMAWLAQTMEPSELTVRECVGLGRFAHTGWLGHRDAADDTAIERALAATGSLALAQRRLSTLSGGERQRVSLARVLAVEASVLLLDEPTTHLDPPHQLDIVRILREQAQQGRGSIVTAIHDMSVALMADRVIVMGPQRLIGHGSVSEALAGDWLSQAFGTSIRIIDYHGSHLWQPQLTKPNHG